MEWRRLHTANVLKALCARFTHIGYTQGLNYVVFFLLCFCDEEHTFWLVAHLIENVLGQSYYGRTARGKALSGFLCEKFTIQNLATQKLKLSKENEQDVTMFLDMHATRIMIPIFVDFLSFESTVNVWNMIFEENSVKLALFTCVLICS